MHRDKFSNTFSKLSFGVYEKLIAAYTPNAYFFIDIFVDSHFYFFINSDIAICTKISLNIYLPLIVHKHFNFLISSDIAICTKIF